MILHFSFTFFAFATQLFSTPVTSSNPRNQAPLLYLRSSAFYKAPTATPYFIVVYSYKHEEYQ